MSLPREHVADWVIDGIECWALNGTSYLGGLNGYCRFPTRPLIEDGYHGIANYVPVHGGITYAEQEDDGFVYGFDTAHYNSESVPRHDPEWIKGQCAIMVAGLRKAADVERKYLRCVTNQGKAKHAQEVLDVAPNADGMSNFGVMINLITGHI